VSTDDDNGYWLIAANGAVEPVGDATWHGSLPTMGVTPSFPIVGAVPTAPVTPLCSCQEILTADGPGYGVSYNGSTLTVTNISSGGNEREAEIPSSEPWESSSSSCATWVSGVSIAQNGVFFRGVSDTGGWDGVELERSFYTSATAYGYFTIVYFHAGTVTVGPSIDLSSYFNGSPVWPMRICAQLTSNGVFSFAVAKAGDSMPALGTPGQGATWTLDSSQMPAAGQTGTYVGHIPTGSSLVISNISIDGNPAPSPLS